MIKLKLMINVLINLNLYLLAQCVAKKPKLWVFGGWFGERYSDNPKAFFEYINKEQPSIKAVWIAKNPQLIKQIRALGFQAHHEKSLSGIYYQLRAEFAFVCQSLHDDIFAPCIGKRTKVVNLWHGLPLKKIMYDVFGDKVVHKNVVGKLVDKLSPYNQIRNDYLLATSVETQNTLANAFRLPKERTLITGFPRNDVFLKPYVKATKSAFKCIYMPTFRGGIGSECDLFAQYGFNVQVIDHELLKNNIELVLRMHPVNKPPPYLIEEIKASKAITIDSSADIFDSIAHYDCMITDYSGAYFDFLLTGRPILFAPFDLEKYKQQERDLYYSYEEVTLAPYAYSWPELIENLIMVKQEDSSTTFHQAYQCLQSKFHQPLARTVRSYSENLYNQVSQL
ncbi:CDP-glycerol glycerophosphotransferase [Colwellia chukchiensis]|uniref:CDP-glycerol glycerophosphotransferase n=1 Tax=Colwellia chukchiensis TaxID=641665 RepID=A0A1H7SE59_9GAMM|nr:CDP-glycerol glycerophosphotransferase family protein [Colwellia chukchiensis]SEL70785.1 CDP-glycerol glycerophosphotransferase [Colwellia chukchiensis]